MGKAPIAFQTAVDYGPMQPVTHCMLAGPPDVLFEGQMDMVPWPCGAVPGAASRETTTCDLQQDTVSRAPSGGSGRNCCLMLLATRRCYAEPLYGLL